MIQIVITQQYRRWNVTVREHQETAWAPYVSNNWSRTYLGACYQGWKMWKDFKREKYRTEF